jgi:hypothetical protein
LDQAAGAEHLSAATGAGASGAAKKPVVKKK